MSDERGGLGTAGGLHGAVSLGRPGLQVIGIVLREPRERIDDPDQ